MFKIGIIGSGNMGRAIGVRLAMAGHRCFFGGRDAAKGQLASKLAGHGSESGTADDAAEFGEIIVWTLRETDPRRVLQRPEALKGKIIIDSNNRDYAMEVKTGAWFDRSIAEQLQDNAPQSSVVKGFNTIAMETFNISAEELRLAGAQIFIAGDDTQAKATVRSIAQDLGFTSTDLGDGPAAFRAAEALGDVIRLLMIDGGRGGAAHLVLSTLPKPTLDVIGDRQGSTYA